MEPTPLMGGLSIFAGVALGLVYFLIDFWEPRLLGFVLGGLVVFVVGLWDDVSSLRPVTKLLGQIIAACIAVSTGTLFNFGGHELFAVLLTIFWIASVTNAFNLIDNMDGLCAGTACISGLVLVAYAFVNGDPVVGMISAAFVGACLGFLWYNFSPASIFMGDSGSMMIGYTFAVVSIMATGKGVGNFVATLAIPVLVLGVPIFIRFRYRRPVGGIADGGGVRAGGTATLVAAAGRRGDGIPAFRPWGTKRDGHVGPENNLDPGERRDTGHPGPGVRERASGRCSDAAQRAGHRSIHQRGPPGLSAEPAEPA
jgi:hypothetical protein